MYKHPKVLTLLSFLFVIFRPCFRFAGRLADGGSHAGRLGVIMVHWPGTLFPGGVASWDTVLGSSGGDA